MKRFLTIIALLAVITVTRAQAMFDVYTPTTPNNYGQSQQNTQRRDNFQTVNAYYINSRGAFQKIRIKVNVVSGTFGGESVYVRAYVDPHIGNWSSMNTQATPITQYSNDAQVIKENFDWKCYVLNVGEVYF